MIIQEKIGHIASFPAGERVIDLLALEWFETGKRILRKRTSAGRDIALRFLRESPALTDGDILYAGEKELIVVSILPCPVIVINPSSACQLAAVCYEIGNKHLPLFFEKDEVLVPFDMPLFRLLSSQGYAIKQDKRKLLYPLKTTVAPHAHSSSSLFSRIMQLTNSGV